MRTAGWWLLAALALGALTGCPRPQERLIIRGGPSLGTAFAELAAAYQAAYPQVQVVADFTCPPCVLLTRPGEPVSFDLFVSPGDFEIQRLSAAGAAQFTETVTVGETRLTLVTSSRAKADIRTVADLHRGQFRRLGLGDPEQVAVGHYAREALRKMGLWEELQDRFSYTQSGCELLKWLALGKDLDAAFVFSLCLAEESGSLRSVWELPAEMAPPVPVQLALSATAPNPHQARAFMAFAQTPPARELLARHGMTPVSAP